MTRRPLLRLASVSKAFGAKRALVDLDLTLVSGEILGLLGPNGAGKTTAIECLVGLATPDSGAILAGDAAVGDGPRAELPRVGVALQDTRLHDKITPAEAIDLFAVLGGFDTDRDEMLARFGLTASARVRYENLSGGQKQALALAIAMLGDPPVIVLDEPTQGLDPRARAALHAMIQTMRAEGRAILIATHDMAEADLLCDRVAVLQSGRLVAEGDTAALIGQMGGWAHVRVECDGPIDLSRCDALAGWDTPAGGAGLRTRNATRAVEQIGAAARAQSITIIALEIGPPKLEDLILSLDAKGAAA